MKINRLLPLAAVLAMGFAHDASAQEIRVDSRISASAVVQAPAKKSTALPTTTDNTRLRAQEESSEQTEPTFELRGDVQPVAYTEPYGVRLLAFLNIDPSLDLTLFHAECDGPVDIFYDGNNDLIAVAFETGTFTFTITSDELPGKSLALELTFIPAFPSSYSIREQDNSYTDFVLTRVDDNTLVYTGTFTVPEGEDSYKFYLDGPEEMAGYYVLGGTGEAFDLSESASTVNVTTSEPYYFSIPAEFRGQTFDFRLNCATGTFTIRRQDYVR